MDPGLATELARAFDRIDDFLAVQASLSRADLGPVHRLQEAVGIGEPERTVLARRIGRVAGAEHTGAVLLGLMVGLLAQDLANEKAIPGRDVRAVATPWKG